MTGYPGPGRTGVTVPSRLVFYFGAFPGGALSVRWNGNALLVEETRGGNFSGTIRVVIPGPGQWETFWKAVEDIGVWTWDPVHENPHGCCGASYWQLILGTGTREVTCSGEDRFPGGQSPELTHDFRALVHAIKTLCGMESEGDSPG